MMFMVVRFLIQEILNKILQNPLVVILYSVYLVVYERCICARDGRKSS